MAARRTNKSATPASNVGGGGSKRAAPRRPTGRARAQSTVPPTSVIGIPIADASWFRPVRAAGRLEPGTLAGKPLSVPDAAATRLLRGIVHAVADIPSDTSTVVVWQRDGSELWVDVGTVTLSSLDGMVRVAVTVGCDQLGKPVVLTVPLKVGTPQAPAGLVMSSVDRLTGPDVVTALWSDAVIAFGWECLLELSRQLCAGLGRDSAGLPLIPGAVAATKGVLVVQAMSRNDLSQLGSVAR